MAKPKCGPGIIIGKKKTAHSNTHKCINTQKHIHTHKTHRHTQKHIHTHKTHRHTHAIHTQT